MTKKLLLNGKKIRIRLIEIDMRIGELAYESGINRSKLSGILCGEYCKETTALKISEVIGLSLEEITDKIIFCNSYDCAALDCEKISRFLSERNISTRDLASMCGVSQQRMDVILNSRKVKTKTANKIADALGVSVSEICKGVKK